MNHIASPSPHSTRRARRRIATTLGAALVGAGIFVTPAVAFADTGAVVARTTDQAGDARANLRNVPNADLLAAGARFTSSTVTVYVDLTAAPSQATLADAAARGLPYGGRFDYTSYLTVGNGAPLSIAFHDSSVTLGAAVGDSDGGYPDPTPACTAYFGPNGSPNLSGSVTVDAAANELSATFSRADVNAAQSCYGGAGLTPGQQVQVGSATSDIQTPYKNAVSGGVVVRDSAGSGPAVTLVD